MPKFKLQTKTGASLLSGYVQEVDIFHYFASGKLICQILWQKKEKGKKKEKRRKKCINPSKNEWINTINGQGLLETRPAGQGWTINWDDNYNAYCDRCPWMTGGTRRWATSRPSTAASRRRWRTRTSTPATPGHRPTSNSNHGVDCAKGGR